MPWLHEKGVQAVVDAVRDLTFPAKAEEISQCAGERYVQASGRLTLPIAEVVAHLPEKEFQSLAEFETAVLKHWKGIRFLEVPEEQRSPEGGFQPTQRGHWPHHAGRTPQGLRHVEHEGGDRGPGPRG